MSAQVVIGRFCAQWFMSFNVQGSAKEPYVVHFEEGHGPHCTCKAFEHGKRDETGFKSCKHIEHVMKHACLWNEQWNDGGDRTLSPIPGSCTTSVVERRSWRLGLGSGRHKCPKCGGPIIYRQIAV
jgi:hypothetical protein